VDVVSGIGTNNLHIFACVRYHERVLSELTEANDSEVRRSCDVQNHIVFRNAFEHEMILDVVDADGSHHPQVGGGVEETDPAVIVKDGGRFRSQHVLKKESQVAENL
jgi:hypothetical protein